MRDISLKPTTLRRARAAGHVQLPAATVETVRRGEVTKGDVLAAAELAGMMAIKRTPELLPHCHPIGVLQSELHAVLEVDGIHLSAEVQTIAATGVEMEALTAVSVAALTVYDMLKGHAPAAELIIGEIRLVEKTGGKSQFGRQLEGASAAVLVLSDTVASGRKPDTAGAAVRDGLAAAGFTIADYSIRPDEAAAITDWIATQLAGQVDFIVTVGGTGLGPRDVTVEAVAPLIDTPLPGFMEAARAFGQARTPYAMLSRGVAGLTGGSVLATFPGSRKGAEETLAAVLPGLVHLIEVCRMARPHPGGYT